MSSKTRAKDPARGRFAARLSQRRKERGFETAYAFFHRPGGRKHFGFSYQHFLLMEKGVRLPSPESLETILDAIGTVQSYNLERLELLELYVRALLGGNPLFEPLFAASQGASPGARSAGETPESAILSAAARRAVGEVPRFSPAQVEVVLGTPAAFQLIEFLLATGYVCTAEELASMLELPPEAVATALRRLGEVGLIEAGKDGRFTCPQHDTDLFFPVGTFTSQRKAWVAEQFGALARPREREHFHNFICLALEPGRRAGTLTDLIRDTARKAYLLRSPGTVTEGEFVTLETRICYRPIRRPGSPPAPPVKG